MATIPRALGGALLEGGRTPASRGLVATEQVRVLITANWLHWVRLGARELIPRGEVDQVVDRLPSGYR